VLYQKIVSYLSFKGTVEKGTIEISWHCPP